ncbi:PREDICTED: caspase-3-like [Amphimedon queenslandica]|uniref:Caspase n=1 Tax=Amphimedon queenslandica TaxID=400682 RepID=A0A1X7VNG6_AMPQE|nr:PREDICTED: caspase-3-like [Amphimedon queenslandica]|eukprot:XP_003383519.1 PREDICTED: caspase-3-like [Amphimedon queenslandica]
MASSSLKQTLKALYAELVRGLDPDSASEFFSEGLLTNSEKESVDAGATRTKKNRNLMDALLRRDPEKALQKIIEVLEGEEGEDKVANEVLLRKIEEKYPHYSYENGLQQQQQQQGPPPPAEVPTREPMNIPVDIKPIGVIPRGSGPTKPAAIPQIAQVSATTPHNEGTDGGRRDRYPMNSVPRGYCIIINNEKFATLRERAGSKWDADSLEELFREYLGFHVERYNDLDSQRIRKLMKSVQEQDHSRLSCLVVAILSHGVNGQVYGTDGVLIKVDDLTDYFNGRWCPSLNGKPKIFLLQACRGGNFDYGAINPESTDSGEMDQSVVSQILDEDETDGGGYSLLPDNADFILAYATTPGYVSWRNSAFGTWFIKAFVDTMYDKASTDHFMDNLIEVNRIVAEEYESRGKQKQMPAPVTTLRYKLYLPPVKRK